MFIIIIILTNFKTYFRYESCLSRRSYDINMKLGADLSPLLRGCDTLSLIKISVDLSYNRILNSLFTGVVPPLPCANIAMSLFIGFMGPTPNESRRRSKSLFTRVVPCMKMLADLSFYRVRDPLSLTKV